MQKKKGSYIRMKLMVFILLAFVFASSYEVNAARSNKVVKVGFFAFDGYHMIDENDNKSGYGYEYLQQMAKYNEWVYDYVGYDKSWSDMLEMLERGEIDILTSAQKTEERMEKYDFSSESIGTSATILTVKSGNQEFLAGEYRTYDGIRVGMIEGNSRNDSFMKFAQEKGFTYEPVYFNTSAELQAALQSGKMVDAIVSSNLRKVENEWILAQFDPSPFYIMVKKGNEDLLKEVNFAVQELKLFNVGLEDRLFRKYYSIDSGEQIPFTVDEQAYIKERKKSGTVLKAIINPDRAPLSYFDDGEVKGIILKIAQEAIDRTGLNIQIVETSSREEYNRIIEDKNIRIDIILDARLDYNEAEKKGYKLTESYMSTEISQVTRKDNNGEIESVAVVKDGDITDRYLKYMYEDSQLVYYDCIEDCIEAVKNKDQDCTYLYTYTAQKYTYDDVKNTLKMVALPNYSTDFAFAIHNEMDSRLLTICNKAIESIDENYVRQTVLEETNYGLHVFSFIGYLYSNPIIAMVFVAVFFLMLIGIILYLFNARSHRLEKGLVKEFERFIRFVCKANDVVAEIDYENKAKCFYSVEGNKIIRDTKPFSSLKNFLDKVHMDDYDKVSKIIQKEVIRDLIENEKDVNFECRMRIAQNDYKWYSHTFQGMGRAGTNTAKLMILSHNVDELKREAEEKNQILKDALEVARRASDAKGTFMSRMSHEIRTPLNAVIGYMSIAEEEHDQEKVSNCIVKAGLAARHLLNIINDVLDISSIESGKMKIANEDFDFKQLINTITTIFYAQGKDKGIQLKVSLNGVTEEWLKGDPLRLNQILMNLLSNAIKFTPKDGLIRLDITQTLNDENKVFMTISVSDSGIGMSKEFMSRLFTPFEQQDASVAQKYGGTGLGLSITKNLVNMMNGNITVASEEGKGTNFTVSLAFEKSGKNTEIQYAPNFSRVKVLLVDDDEGACEYMQTVLNRCGVKCDVAYGGEEAIKKLVKKAGTNHPYDMCLMDWNMPGMDGLEIAQKMKEMCQTSLPIIIATAYDYSDVEERAKEIGINKIISKPIFQSTIFDILVNTYGKYTPQGAETVDREDMSGMRILLAEDNEMNMEIAMNILSKAGITITPAVNGKEVVDLFLEQQGAYDAILMDVQMPILDGYEATKKIRESDHPEAKTIPIIAMTANAFAEDVSEALSAGMNAHVAKPINYKKLFATLDKLVTKK